MIIYGVGSNYSEDVPTFIDGLPKIFNYKVIDYDFNQEYVVINKDNLLNLLVSVFRDEGVLSYMITCPISNGEFIDISFYSNHLFTIHYYSMDDWEIFIDNLQSYVEGDVEKNDIVESYKQTRNNYMYWCKVFSVNKMLIFMNWHYEICGLDNEVEYPIFRKIEDILRIAINKDGLVFFNIKDILEKSNVSTIEGFKRFREEPRCMGFYDEF